MKLAELAPDAEAPAAQDPLDSLNPQQRLAVVHGTVRIAAVGGNGPDVTTADAVVPGPLLVIAGAGTGKTSTLAARVAHLIRGGADPQRLLLLTFSRRAAQALERRAGAYLGEFLGTRDGRGPPGLPWAGTFHAVGARLLREYAPRIGLADQFTIHDRADAEDLLGMLRHELGFATTAQRFPTKATCLSIYSRVVNSEASLDAVLAADFPWCAAWSIELAELFAAYTEAKQAQQVLDYDDLLLYWAQMMAEPALAADVGARFDHVLIDEYQDTNRLQATILLALKPDGRGLTVVGDDAQAIYGFRAATVRNILDFPGQFTPPARVIALERNYRSTRPILDASNAVIGLAGERHAKTLWTERDGIGRPQLVTVRDEAAQAQCVAEQVLALREEGLALRSQAVLFRSASHSAQLELELARRGIPFVKYGGLRFLEAAHVKDLLSVLRWAQNPRQRLAGLRVVQLLPGIGPATARRLLDATDAAADPIVALRAFDPPAAAAPSWATLLGLLETLRAPGLHWPADVDAAARWYEPQLERLYEDAGARLQDIRQLAAIAATYASRERFLTEVTLDPPDATSAEAGVPSRDDDYLILSTIHSAKGQEWKSVDVLNVVDGCIPSDLATGSAEEIDEERRLLYVAMTRAKDRLRLLVPQRFHVHNQPAAGDRHVYAARTRFIPAAIAGLFDTCAWPAAPAVVTSGAGTSQDSGTRIDVAARIRARWRPN